MFIAKKHEDESGHCLIALSDKDILGKTFEEGIKVLDLSVEFYNGTEITPEKLDDYIKAECAFNAVGKKSVEFLIKRGLAEQEDIKTVDNVPFVMISQK